MAPLQPIQIKRDERQRRSRHYPIPMPANEGVIIKPLLTPDQVRNINREIEPIIDTLDVGSKHEDGWTKEPKHQPFDKSSYPQRNLSKEDPLLRFEIRHPCKKSLQTTPESTA